MLEKRLKILKVLPWFGKVLKISISFIMHFFTLLNISQKTKKIKCVSDDELKKHLEKDELHDK